MKFLTAYGAKKPVRFATDPVSMTHQSEAPQCDINTIMLKYQKTGVLNHVNRFEGRYADLTATPTDYHESMNAVLAAQEMFEALPSSIRKRFHNDPGAYVEFVSNPENAEEMIRLGLATARQGASDVIEDPTPPKKPKAAPAASPEPKDPPKDD